MTTEYGTQLLFRTGRTLFGVRCHRWTSDFDHSYNLPYGTWHMPCWGLSIRPVRLVGWRSFLGDALSRGCMASPQEVWGASFLLVVHWFSVFAALSCRGSRILVLGVYLRNQSPEAYRAAFESYSRLYGGKIVVMPRRELWLPILVLQFLSVRSCLEGILCMSGLHTSSTRGYF